MTQLSKAEAAKLWGAIGLQSFGGPAGQIALMQRKVVDERGLVSESRFLHALSYCMLLPGPEAHQLAIYLGWLLNGAVGGLLAGVLFLLPGVLAMLGLSWLYVAHGEVSWIAGVFAGLGPAVLAIVVQAVLRVGRRTLKQRALFLIAVGAFMSLAVFGVPFPVVIGVAAGLGWLSSRWWPAASEAAAEREPESSSSDHPQDLHEVAPSWRRTAGLLLLGVPLWLGPVWLAGAWLGVSSTVVKEGWFFAGTALVTFGGAYAVLSYVAQRAVEDFGWLASGEMIKGLGLAETTPGPLILVVQFVAFLGAYSAPGALNPWVAAVLGSLITTWVTFVPSFLFIFLGAPYVERLRSNQALRAALQGVMAAVVGVIANLALYFALHTLFTEVASSRLGPLHFQWPDWSSLNLVNVALAAIAGWALLSRGWSVLRVLGLCAALGAAASVVLG